MRQQGGETAFTVFVKPTFPPQVQKISIFGPIGQQTVESLKFQIDSLDRNQPLTVEINSDGGSVADGVTCFNLLRGWPGGLTTEVVGWALSVASVIVQSGSVRKAHDSALFMVHAPWTTTTGNANEFRDSAQLLDQVGQTMLTVYRRTGQKDAVIHGWLDGTDHWFTATEALALGLIDEIIFDIAEQPAAPANASATRHPIPLFLSTRINAMTTTTTDTTEAIRAAAIKSEGERRHGIRASFAKFAERDGVSALLAECENTPSISVQAAGLKLLAHLGKDSSPITGHYVPRGTTDRLSEFKQAASDAILARAGIRVTDPHPGARDLQRTSIVGLAENILSMRGEYNRGMSAAATINAAMATDDFPLLLGNIANKALSLGYLEAPSGHALFTGEREVPDFKKNTLVNLSEAPALEEVAELSDYRHGAMSDSASTFKLATFGKIIQLSRQALINDDAQAFTRLP
jgi:ATP-dependent protease ClpP protease subunit